MTETMRLPRQARGVSLRAQSFDAGANTVDVVFTTGAAVQRYSWDDGPYVETLDVTPKAVRLGRLNAGAPFLNTHSSYDLSDVIGSVVPGSARIEGGEGVATIKLSGAAADADTVGKIRDGVIRNVSVGYLVHQVVKTEAKDGAAATARVTDWEPIEISAVPIPADPGAQVRSEGAPGETLYDCVVTRAEPAVAAAAPRDAAQDAVAQERARTQGILATARQLRLPGDLADKHVAEGTTLDAFRSVAIDAAAATRDAPKPEAIAAPAASNGDAAMTDRANDQHAQPAVPVLDLTRVAPTAPMVPPAPLDANAVRVAERERISGIRAVARKLKLADDVADSAIEGGTSLESFRTLAIDAVAERQNDGQVTVTARVSDAQTQNRSYAQPRVEKPKGTDATRAIIALAATRGSRQDAAAFVAHHYGSDGEPVARALSTSVGSAGGFLVPVEMSAEIIELLRPASTVMAMGPRILPMPSGNMMIPRVQGGSNANYVGENLPIGASQPSFGGAQLSAKKLASLVPISNDMIRYPTPSTDAIVREDMVGAVAQRADLAFVRGQGSQFSPRGFLSFAAALTTCIGSALPPSSNLFTASNKVGTAYASQSRDNASAALQSVTSDLSVLELALEGKDIKMVKPGWIFSPRTKTYLMNIRDGLGNQVYYKEMSEGLLRGKPFKTTTQIPNNLSALSSDGVTTTFDGSEIYLADFSEVFIGEAYGLELDVFPGGTYLDASGNMVSGISNDQTVMRAIVQHDMNMRQEAAVAVLTGVRWF